MESKQTKRKRRNIWTCLETALVITEIERAEIIGLAGKSWKIRMEDGNRRIIRSVFFGISQRSLIEYREKDEIAKSGLGLCADSISLLSFVGNGRKKFLSR